MTFRAGEGDTFPMTPAEWLEFARRASFYEARERAAAMGIPAAWDCEHAKTPDGYYQVRGGIDYAIAKSLAAAPFADLLWMETKTADLDDAKQFAEAIHAVYPDKMLAYNLSPSFNWDTTGMSDDADARASPTSSASSATSSTSSPTAATRSTAWPARSSPARCAQDGMLALARLQRKLPPARVAVPHAADAGRRPARRRRAHVDLRAHLDAPRRWARARPSSSTWCRPRCRPAASRSGWGPGARHWRVAGRTQGLAQAAHRRLRPARARHPLPRRREGRSTSSSRRSRTGAAAASSRCATRTPSTRACARSAS